MAQYGSSDSGASLGDILGAALKKRTGGEADTDGDGEVVGFLARNAGGPCQNQPSFSRYVGRGRRLWPIRHTLPKSQHVQGLPVDARGTL